MGRSPTLTSAERRDQARQARQRCPRRSHAAWKPRSRANDPLELPQQSNADRIPGLVPVRHGRMSQSPFAFFRGSAIIQARDLAASPASGITVQACGDCHLMNFGGFATPERNLVFDVNDFDETFPAPWEWDVKRLAASIVVAARHLGFSEAAAESAVRAAVASYCRMMSEYAGYKRVEMWYTQIRLEDLLEFFRADKEAVGRLKAAAAKARSRTSENVFPKLTMIADGRRTIVDNPPFIYHPQQVQQRGWARERQKQVRQYVASMRTECSAVYGRYSWQDTAVKVVGVGSVGTRCFVGLYLAGDDDPLFLQTKEARRSVLESPRGKSRFANQGERVVIGQRLMQAASDIFLGWFRLPGGHDYYVRQLRDMKVAAEIETFTPRMLRLYATMCGWALARAHAKAGDAAGIAGYLGKGGQFEGALWSYANAYADQVERDFEAFRRAIRVGKLKADTDEAEGLGFLP
jgi:uncharacterized protein (DUF2252 family)